MCTVSNVGDYWDQRIIPNYPTSIPYSNWPDSEKEKLKRDLVAVKKLLKAAIEFDKETGQPDCHIEEKIRRLKQMAEIAGVDMEGIL